MSDTPGPSRPPGHYPDLPNVPNTPRNDFRPSPSRKARGNGNRGGHPNTRSQTKSQVGTVPTPTTLFPGLSATALGKQRAVETPEETSTSSNPDRLRTDLESLVSLVRDQATTQRAQQKEIARLNKALNRTITELRNQSQQAPTQPRPGSVDLPLPSVEIRQSPNDPSVDPNLRASHAPEIRITPDVRTRDDSVSSSRERKSKLTESIKKLDNGKEPNPTFKSWQLDILDRLEINYDHYPTDRSRQALIWGATEGLARTYLLPRYRVAEDPFSSAEEMLKLLASYFLTGLETEVARKEFLGLSMEPRENFSDFHACWLSAAIRGKITRGEYFFYLWEKTSQSLRDAAVANKGTWNYDYDTMVSSLRQIDHDRRQNWRLSVPAAPSQTAAFRPTSRTPAMAPRSTPRATFVTPSAPANPAPRVSHTARLSARPPTAPVPDRFRTPRAEGPTTSKEPVCYNCNQPGHYRDQCPKPPANRIREIVADEPEGSEEEQEVEQEEEEEVYHDTEDVREGNDFA
jgi:hypothetical protein